MAGIYDWILNGLKTSQSPATNHLPTPIPSQNLTGLPVPFQTMPSESAANMPFLKLADYMTNQNANSTIPQDVGTTPNKPNDPLKTFILQRFMSSANGNQNKGASTVDTSPKPVMSLNVGVPQQIDYSAMPSLSSSYSGQGMNARKLAIANMMRELQS